MTDDQPHVLLLCLDTVRKDVYDEFATRLRDRATITFDEMRAASSWSVPSHASMLTGELPSDHGVHAANRDFATLDPVETWLADLDGYQTDCISANIYASPAFGFDSLVDECRRVSPECWFPEGLDINAYIRDRDPEDGLMDFVRTVAQHDHSTQSLANGAIQKAVDVSQRLPIPKPVDDGARAITKRIRQTLTTAAEPMLLFANLMDAHGPHTPFRGLDTDIYDAPPGFSSLDYDDWDINVADGVGAFGEELSRTRSLYAAEVEYLDRRLDNLLDTLDDQLDRDVVVIITADHGENLGYEADKYLANHTSSLTEGLLHVPFDIVAPGYNVEIGDYASHLDLGQIVRQVLRGGPVEKAIETTPAAEIAGSGTGLPDEGDLQQWDQTRRAVYNPGHEQKYIRTERSEEVYDVAGDPCHQTSLDAAVPSGAFDGFENSFETFVERVDGETGDQDREVDGSVEARLKELGYR